MPIHAIGFDGSENGPVPYDLFMYRKIVSLTTTLGAILILLAHAAVPHHQHENQLVLKPIGICEASCDHHTEDFPVYNHHMPANQPVPCDQNGATCCFLADMMVFLPAEQQLTISGVLITHELVSQQHGLIHESFQTPSPLSIGHVKRKTYLIHPLAQISILQPGLRAPPSC